MLVQRDGIWGGALIIAYTVLCIFAEIKSDGQVSLERQNALLYNSFIGHHYQHYHLYISLTIDNVWYSKQLISEISHKTQVTSWMQIRIVIFKIEKRDTEHKFWNAMICTETFWVWQSFRIVVHLVFITTSFLTNQVNTTQVNHAQTLLSNRAQRFHKF